jgi:predicted Rossmann fold flavoprotein
VLQALRARLDRSGAELALEEPMQHIEQQVAGFQIVTPKRTLVTSRLILTTGGQSYPGSGTTGDGYRWCAELGHTIVPPRPALVPLTTNAAWVLDLKGMTLPDVTLTILDWNKKLASRRSALLFAHFGLTGPAALDVSRVVSGHSQPATLIAEIDLIPDSNETNTGEWLRNQLTAAGKKTLASILATLIPQRLAETLLHLAGIADGRRAAEASRDERNSLLRLLHHLPVPLTGTLGFKKAEVTAGGVSLTEVDSRTMESKLVPGLFLAGEILDLDGPIGGYNFQAAWSTGWLAGSSV